MNPEHMELLRSDGWRDLLEQLIVPFALDSLTWADLGDDVLEVGPGPGTTTELLRRHLPRLTAIELDPDLVDQLREQLEGRVIVDEGDATAMRSEEHTSELQSLMRISYAVFCLKKKNKQKKTQSRQKRKPKHITY